MKTGYAARQWLDRLRSLGRSAPAADTDAVRDAMSRMNATMKLMTAGDLAGATATIRDTLHRVRGSGSAAGPEPALEGTFEVLKGTFSDYERPEPAVDRAPATGTGAQFQEATY